MNMESPLQLCSKAISSPYNPNNHYINANQTPPLPNSKQTKCKKIKVRVKLAHSASTRMMAVAYTSLVTYETTLVTIKMSSPDVLLVHSKNQIFHTRIQIWHPTYDYGIMCRSQ